MKRNAITVAVLAGALSAMAAVASAAEKVDLGKREFDAKCVICHGAKGKGDGPYAGLLTKTLPDLTTLAKRNGGVFPLQRVYETIDGGPSVTVHGTRDMPIWGTDYRLRAAEYYIDVPYDAEAFVRARLLALSEYIYRLQVK